MPRNPPDPRDPSELSPPPLPPKEKPSDVLGILDVLGEKVDGLSHDVEHESQLREEKIKAIKNQTSWLQKMAIAASVFALVAVVAAVSSFITIREVRRDDKNGRIRDQAGLAGVCGVMDVNRIQIQNFLTEINVKKPLIQTSTWPDFFKEQFALFTPLNCRAVVPNDVGVKLCLEYPPTNDPITGKPTPTTEDPLNKKNCG